MESRKSSGANLKKVELARLSQNAFCCLKTQLYEGVLTFDELAHKDGVEGVLPLSFKSNFPREKEYTCRYKISKKDGTTKQGTKNTALLLSAELYLDGEGLFSTPYMLREGREKMKRRSFTLIETMICLSLLSLLLGSLFFWYQHISIQKSKLHAVKWPILEERFAQQRLNTVLRTTKKSSSFPPQKISSSSFFNAAHTQNLS